MSPPRPGRPPRISHDAILDAVLDVGFGHATITRVATTLGVEPSSLYRHVTSRAAMLDAAADRALARAGWPDAPTDPTSWRSYLRDYADSIWDVLAAHPGLGLHLRASRTVPPTLVRRILDAVGFLRDRVGLTVLDAVVVVDTLGDLTADSSLIAEGLAADETSADPPFAVRYAGLVEQIAADAPELHDLTTDYLAVVTASLQGPGSHAAWWRRKVDLLLDGVARTHDL